MDSSPQKKIDANADLSSFSPEEANTVIEKLKQRESERRPSVAESVAGSVILPPVPPGTPSYFASAKRQQKALEAQRFPLTPVLSKESSMVNVSEESSSGNGGDEEDGQGESKSDVLQLSPRLATVAHLELTEPAEAEEGIVNETRSGLPENAFETNTEEESNTVPRGLTDDSADTRGFSEHGVIWNTSMSSHVPHETESEIEAQQRNASASFHPPSPSLSAASSHMKEITSLKWQQNQAGMQEPEAPVTPLQSAVQSPVSAVSGQPCNAYEVYGAGTKSRVRSKLISRTIHRWSHYVKSGAERYLLSPKTVEGDEALPRPTEFDIDGSKMVWTAPVAENIGDVVIKGFHRRARFAGAQHFWSFHVINGKSQVMVERRYKDFQWLADCLCQRFGPLVLASLPLKPDAGKYKQDPIETRRVLLEMYLQRLSRHPLISNSRAFQVFMTETQSTAWKAEKRAIQKSYTQEAQNWMESIVVHSPKVTGVETESFVDHFQGFARETERVLNLMSSAVDSFAGSTSEFESSYEKLSLSLAEALRPTKTSGLNRTLNKHSYWCYKASCTSCGPMSESIEEMSTALTHIANSWGRATPTVYLPFLYSLQELASLTPQLNNLHNIFYHTTLKLREARKLQILGRLGNERLENYLRKCVVLFHLVLTEMELWHSERRDDFLTPLKRAVEGMLVTQRSCIENLESVLCIIDKRPQPLRASQLQAIEDERVETERRNAESAAIGKVVRQMDASLNKKAEMTLASATSTSTVADSSLDLRRGSRTSTRKSHPLSSANDEIAQTPILADESQNTSVTIDDGRKVTSPSSPKRSFVRQIMI